MAKAGLQTFVVFWPAPFGCFHQFLSDRPRELRWVQTVDGRRLHSCDIPLIATLQDRKAVTGSISPQ